MENLAKNTLTTVSRIIRLPEVMDRIGLGRSTIYDKIASGCFPEPLSLGARSVGWWESEVNEWLASRPRVSLYNEG